MLVVLVTPWLLVPNEVARTALLSRYCARFKREVTGGPGHDRFGCRRASMYPWRQAASPEIGLLGIRIGKDRRRIDEKGDPRPGRLIWRDIGKTV